MVLIVVEKVGDDGTKIYQVVDGFFERGKIKSVMTEDELSEIKPQCNSLTIRQAANA